MSGINPVNVHINHALKEVSKFEKNSSQWENALIKNPDEAVKKQFQDCIKKMEGEIKNLKYLLAYSKTKGQVPYDQKTTEIINNTIAKVDNAINKARTIFNRPGIDKGE